MNTQTRVASTTNGPVMLFVCLAWVAGGLSLARNFGVMGAVAERRTVGCAMGLVIVGFGLFLQRLQRRNALAGNSSKAAADRLIGWILVSAGLACSASFLSASLERAKLVASIIGVGVLVMFVAVWSWRLSKAATRKPVFPILLAGAYVYIAVTACAAFLFDAGSWFAGLAPWMMVMFWTLYTTGSAAFLDKRAPSA